MSGRDTALQALMACRKEGAWSNGILKEYTFRAHLDKRDSALASRLCYGVLQNRILLDFYLEQLLTGKVKDLHPVVRDILHLGLYQILLLDRIPDAAAVNEAVTQAKKYCKWRSASGLVNGVLRNAIRKKDGLHRPEDLSRRYSHPQKLLDLLKQDLGEDALEPMLKANNDIPPTVVQVNTLRTDSVNLTKRLESEGVTVQPHSWLPDCLILTGTGDLEKLPSFREGLYYVQDGASKLSVLCGQIPENSRVLDCCAAPGGKSFAAAIAMNGTGQIISCDLHSHKIPLIEKGAGRLGFANITARVQNAGEENPEWLEKMDAVIADVPCSGYGIIRKKPDIRYKDPDAMEALPALQGEILNRQAAYVKHGGLLLYSTCTLLRRENQEVVEKFLNTHGDFHREPLPLPEGLPDGSSGMLTLIPGKYDTDGFFICRMRRD